MTPHSAAPRTDIQGQRNIDWERTDHIALVSQVRAATLGAQAIEMALPELHAVAIIIDYAPISDIARDRIDYAIRIIDRALRFNRAAAATEHLDARVAA